MAEARVWMSGTLPDQPGPLRRFLPPVPAGVVQEWLSAITPSGSLILDPFGNTPLIAIEAARAGYRVLVAANNPVARFMLDMTANPPQAEELNAALAELSSTVKGSERLPQHISNLYLTECANCGTSIPADAFLWERGANAPYARIYHCSKCSDAGEHPALESDAQRALAHQKRGLTWARALERVAPLNDPDREHAEEALETYLPRAVYALMTLINAIDQLAPSPAATAERLAWISRQRSLIALLLSACDKGNSLWSPAGARSRPRQLSRPGRFIEYNLWKILEESISQWTLQGETESAIPIVMWPQLPPAGGGIAIFEGRIKDLIDQLKTQPVKALVSAIPRPNQAYWSLSALWAGWLWGREASAPFKSVLRRRRYDWAWHTTALCSALQSIETGLSYETPFFTLVSEVEPGFLTALFIAARLSGFDLHSLALRSDANQCQAQWTLKNYPSRAQEAQDDGAANLAVHKLQDIALRATIEHLLARGEPAEILPIHTATLVDLLPEIEQFRGETAQAADLYTTVQNALQKAFLDRVELQRFGGTEGSLEGGKWWLGKVQQRKGAPAGLPLADRVEMEVVRAFQRQPAWTLQALDHRICSKIPGLETPDQSLILSCVGSYAEVDALGNWQLRPGEESRRRRMDLGEMHALLDQIMHKVGLITDTPVFELPANQFGLIYEDSSGKPIYQFQIIVSAVLGEVMQLKPSAQRGAYLLCPGSRSGLIDYKKRNNPLLSHQIDQSWQIIKFRLVRRLVERSFADLEDLERQLAMDPLSNRDPQIQLL